MSPRSSDSQPANRADEGNGYSDYNDDAQPGCYRECIEYSDFNDFSGIGPEPEKEKGVRPELQLLGRSLPKITCREWFICASSAWHVDRSMWPDGAASSRFATRPVLRTRPDHPKPSLPVLFFLVPKLRSRTLSPKLRFASLNTVERARDKCAKQRFDMRRCRLLQGATPLQSIMLPALTRGEASWAVRSQAEPGNEGKCAGETPAPQHRTLPSVLRFC